MSQEDLEERSGVSQATISRYEKGPTENVSLWNAMLMARSLGATVEELFAGDLETIKRAREERARAALSHPATGTEG